MKASLRIQFALVLAASLVLVSPSFAQNLGSLPGKAKTAAAGISVSFDGSKSTVIYGGRKVYEGPTKQKAAAFVKNVNGVQYAAAFDGNRVVWENVKGASSKVK